MDEHSRRGQTALDSETSRQILEKIGEMPRDADEVEAAVEQTIREVTEQAAEDDGFPEWDGTDSAIVADKDATDFEEPLSGIHICYRLNREEIKKALRASGVLRVSRQKMIVQTVVLGLIGLFFLLSYLTAEQPRTVNLVVAAACLLLTGTVWFMPEYQLAARARQLCTDKSVEAEIFPDIIKIGSGEGAWEIPLDGTSEYRETDSLLMVITPQNRCVAFPLRSIEPALVHDIVAMLAAGTNHN